MNLDSSMNIMDKELFRQMYPQTVVRSIYPGLPLSDEVFHPPKSSKPETIELETDIKPPYLLRTAVNINTLAYPEFRKLMAQENIACELVPQYAAHGYWWTLHSCENHPAVVLKWLS